MEFRDRYEQGKSRLGDRLNGSVGERGFSWGLVILIAFCAYALINLVVIVARLFS